MSRILRLKQLFGNKCYYCGCKATQNATVEHLIPTSQYRIDNECNLRIAHYNCNQMRGKLYQTIGNILRRLSMKQNKKVRKKSRAGLGFCMKNLTKQDGVWTRSYLDELQFTVEHPNFVQDMLNGIFTNLFFRRKQNVVPTGIRS